MCEIGVVHRNIARAGAKSAPGSARSGLPRRTKPWGAREPLQKAGLKYVD